ncbi:hypothetical protein Bhyg_13594 [Pseudolycoriella hygida]|uniref:Uncharacterized protein n=1 Tax=Pseudolycoriella hygida TaxID=35572 RepID=A0A9Q0MNE1_9DIPT|nr:hypothetical protein Bhyg_13594 [Pseudolycoriella hygida]
MLLGRHTESMRSCFNRS